MSKKFGFIGWICFIILIIGGFDAGVFGVTGGNLFALIFKGFVFRLVYIVIGLSAVYMTYTIFRKAKD